MALFRSLAVSALLVVTACDSAGKSTAMGSDANATSVEGNSPNSSLNGDGTSVLAPGSGSAHAPEAGICAEPLDAANCPASYPTNPCASRGWPTAFGSCGAFAAILFGAVPHYGVCLYESVDGGILVGSQGVSDTPEFCQGTAWEVTAGQVPADCAMQLAFATDAASCVDAQADGGIDALFCRSASEAGADGAAGVWVCGA